MASKRQKKPDFYKQFMDASFFPESNKIVKYQDSTNYWIFKAGKKVYKVKKKEEIQTTIPIEQVFCQQIVQQLNHYSPELETTLASVEEQDNVYRLNLTPVESSSTRYYVIVMNQLVDRYFLDHLIGKGKLTDKAVARISHFLADRHQNLTVSDSKTIGSHEQVRQKLQDLIYQSKKHLGQTITQPMIDMISRPLERYIEDNRKLLGQRIRKGFIRTIHGEFISRKIHVSPTTICVLGRTSDPLKDRFNDVAADIAGLTVELTFQGLAPLSLTLIKEYIKASGDSDLEKIHPIYQALKSLQLGLENSVAYQQREASDGSDLKNNATTFYEQAIDVARHL